MAMGGVKDGMGMINNGAVNTADRVKAVGNVAVEGVQTAVHGVGMVGNGAVEESKNVAKSVTETTSQAVDSVKNSVGAVAAVMGPTTKPRLPTSADEAAISAVENTAPMKVAAKPGNEAPAPEAATEGSPSLVEKINSMKELFTGYVNMIKAIIFEQKKQRIPMLESLRIAADAGILACQIKLGDKLLYGQGVGVEYVSPSEGAEWHKKAAEQGTLRSQLIVADCYLQGVGFDANPDEADRFLRMFEWEPLPPAVKPEQAALMSYKLGMIYFTGKIPIGKEKYAEWKMDDVKAFEWMKRSADLDCTDAISQLALFYRDGVGVEKDMQLAFQNWRTAAERGDSRSAYNTGFCYYRGNGVARDYMKAVEWVKLAAKRGDPEAYFTLGEWHYDMKLYVLSIDEFKKAAESGLPRAQYAVGWHYYYGEGVERDYSEAVKWFFMAADKDCAEAYFYLGMCVMEGKGVVADPEEARRLMEYAKELNPNLKIWIENLEKDVARYLTDQNTVN